MDTYTVQRTGKSPLRQLIMAICGLVGALMLAGSVQASGIAFPRNRAETMPLPEVPEVNFTVKVTNPLCPQYTQSWSYSSVEDAVKDTIPGEWWDPSYYTPNNESLKSAAIIIRSVIK